VCELLGISSSAIVRPVGYLKTFWRRGQELQDGQGNPDGWGLALYPDDGKAVQVIKEAIPAASSQLAKFLSTYECLCSRTFIAHVRRATRGVVAYFNSHPFSREVRGREYAFAHNGTLRNTQGFSHGRHRPAGDSDSETLFCHLMNFVEEKGICGWTELDLIELWKFLISVNRMPTKEDKPTKLNLLLTDGEMLIAYTDFYGIGGLHQLTLRVKDEALFVGRDSSASHKLKGNPEKFISVVATRPVSCDKRWVSIRPGELCAFRNGGQVFSSGALRSKDRPQLTGKRLPG
jgi:glutamine amidotransferase